MKKKRIRLQTICRLLEKNRHRPLAALRSAGFKPRFAGRGCFRRVYAISSRHVLKIGDKEHNRKEYKFSRRYRKSVAKVFWISSCGKLLLQQKAKVIGERNIDYSGLYAKKFDDLHDYNVGIVGKRVVLLDAGLGRRC